MSKATLAAKPFKAKLAESGQHHRTNQSKKKRTPLAKASTAATLNESQVVDDFCTDMDPTAALEKRSTESG